MAGIAAMDFPVALVGIESCTSRRDSCSAGQYAGVPEPVTPSASPGRIVSVGWSRGSHRSHEHAKDQSDANVAKGCETEHAVQQTRPTLRHETCWATRNELRGL
eukprot:1986361-Prymnesium_polylepis.1